MGEPAECAVEQTGHRAFLAAAPVQSAPSPRTLLLLLLPATSTKQLVVATTTMAGSQSDVCKPSRPKDSSILLGKLPSSAV